MKDNLEEENSKYSNMEQQVNEASDNLKYKIKIIKNKYNEKYDQ